MYFLSLNAYFLVYAFTLEVYNIFYTSQIYDVHLNLVMIVLLSSEARGSSKWMRVCQMQQVELDTHTHRNAQPLLLWKQGPQKAQRV